MNTNLNRSLFTRILLNAMPLVVVGSSAVLLGAAGSGPSPKLNFGPEQALGRANKNPAAPFLRFGPDGRLYAVWTEADDRQPSQSQSAHRHESAHEHDSMMKRS